MNVKTKRFMDDLDSFLQSISLSDAQLKAEICKLVVRAGDFSLGLIGRINKAINSLNCPCDRRDLELLIIEYITSSNNESKQAANNGIIEILEQKDGFLIKVV